MVRFVVQDALRAAYELQTLVELFEGYKKETPAQKVVNGHCQTISRQIKTANEVIKKLHLTESASKIERIKTNLELWPYGHNLSQAYTLLHEFHRSFIGELQAVNFAFIPTEKIPYYENENLFGDAAGIAFPEARKDIKDAGNCIAAELYTAAVFHLMRTVEHALRVIAFKYRIKKVKSGKPITEETWGHIIEAIQTKLDELKGKYGQTKRQKDEADFYRFCLLECKLFKEYWRDDVMHTKGDYNEQDALKLFVQVKDFINRIVKQGIKKPRVISPC